jgi:hypothetical protein
LNGVEIVTSREVNPDVALLERQITLRLQNQLVVELRGAPESGVAVQVIGVDNDPPVITTSISPQPNAASWNNSNVTVSFTCSDQTSGIAFCPAPITVTTEGANQVVSGTASDKAGNTARASVTVNLDKTPPTITGTINPPPDAGGWNSSAVTVNFTCSDALSGVAFCSSPVSLTTEGANQRVTGTARDVAGNTATTTVTVNISFNFFYVRSYGGKCLDYGPPWQGTGPTVFLNDCSQVQAQGHSIRVVEVNDKHEVVLFAGRSVIGIHNPPTVSEGGPPPPLSPQTEFALELQGYDPILATTANQIFALDGDSIILASSRVCLTTDPTNPCPPLILPPPPLLGHLVVEVQNARGKNGSPLVAGVRKLSDNEFWDFNAIDGSGRQPTRGFVRVATLCDLLRYIPLNEPPNPNPCPDITASPGTPGTVIQIDPGADINLTGLPPLQIPAGVTIRGGRRSTLFGPLLHIDTPLPDTTVMANTAGDEVRITGLRLQGTSRSNAPGQTGSIGVYAHEDLYIHAIVDHNDISGWTENGVRAGGNENRVTACDSSEFSDPLVRPHKTFVLRNFIHHNRMQNFGYGVEANVGGYPFIDGNTFLSNRHAIAAGFGTAHSGYRAWHNLVLSDAPLQHGLFGVDFYTHDFDMHGSPDEFDGRGGDYVDMFRNTFLGGNRYNYELRGYPCNDSDYHSNVSLWVSQDGAVNFKTSSTQFWHRIEHINVGSNPNQFGFSNPTNQLGVGDFDGDGVQDVFLATGSAWYYAPAANAEWRFLSAKTEQIGQVLLGDFDGDGRTDVVAIHNGQFVVSWGGISDWEVLNADPTAGRLYLLPDAVTAMAVGDFDGDGIADVFWADVTTTTWWVSYGGNTPFVAVQTSSFRVQDLRFGDFDGNRTTDVFGVVSGRWMVSYSPRLVRNQPFSSWTPLPVSLTSTVDGLVVADFNGNGIADVAKIGDINWGLLSVISWNWMFSYDGAAGWTSHQITPTTGGPEPCGLTFTVSQVTSPLLAAIGPFAGNPGADILLWGDGGGNNFCIVPGGTGDAQRQSRQDMR